MIPVNVLTFFAVKCFRGEYVMRYNAPNTVKSWVNLKKTFLTGQKNRQKLFFIGEKLDKMGNSYFPIKTFVCAKL